MKIKFVSNNATQFMLFVMAFYLVFIVIVGSISAVIGISFTPWFLIFSQVVGLLLPLFIWLAIKKDTFKRNMPNRPLGVANFFLVIGLGIFAQPAMMILSFVTSLFFPNVATELIGEFAAQPFWLMILAVAVTPGIIEELLFRGYIQTNTPKTTVFKIALLNGLLFAIIHMSPQQFLYAFAMGMLLAYMVYYTKNIWAGIIPHFIMNASQVSLGRWAAGTEETLAALDAFEYTDAIPPELIGVLVVGMLALVSPVIAIILLRTLISYNKKRFAEEVKPVEKTNDAQPDEAEDKPALCVDWCIVATIAIYLFTVIAML